MSNNKQELTYYEKSQSFNPLVSFLHSIRFKYLVNLFNQLTKDNPSKIFKVVDIGCAHAKNFDILNSQFKISYLGIEIGKESCEVAQERYGHHENFRIINDSIEHHTKEFLNVDVIIALETMEHIPEHVVVKVIEKIGLAKPTAFICSVPNEVGPIVLIKNIGSFLTGYMRHKEYTWSETFHAGFYNLDKVGLHDTGHKGFDWRWLAQTIRHNMRISKIYSSPFAWLPKTFSFSIIFISKPLK